MPARTSTRRSPPLIAATDEAAAGASPALVARMHEAYTAATRLEYLFWDGAWRLETWPI